MTDEQIDMIGDMLKGYLRSGGKLPAVILQREDEILIMREEEADGMRSLTKCYEMMKIDQDTTSLKGGPR